MSKIETQYVEEIFKEDDLNLARELEKLIISTSDTFIHQVIDTQDRYVVIINRYE